MGGCYERHPSTRKTIKAAANVSTVTAVATTDISVCPSCRSGESSGASCVRLDGWTAGVPNRADLDSFTSNATNDLHGLYAHPARGLVVVASVEWIVFPLDVLGEVTDAEPHHTPPAKLDHDHFRATA